MCSRYKSIQTTETLEKRFRIRIPNGLNYNSFYNISPGSLAPAIINDKPKTLQLFIENKVLAEIITRTHSLQYKSKIHCDTWE